MTRLYSFLLFASVLGFIWAPDQYRTEIVWTIFVCLIATGFAVAAEPSQAPEHEPETIYSKQAEDA